MHGMIHTFICQKDANGLLLSPVRSKHLSQHDNEHVSTSRGGWADTSLLIASTRGLVISAFLVQPFRRLLAVRLNSCVALHLYASFSDPPAGSSSVHPIVDLTRALHALTDFLRPTGATIESVSKG